MPFIEYDESKSFIPPALDMTNSPVSASSVQVRSPHVPLYVSADIENVMPERSVRIIATVKKPK